MQKSKTGRFCRRRRKLRLRFFKRAGTRRLKKHSACRPSSQNPSPESFFRNAINIGLPAIVCKDLPDAVEDRDTMVLHMSEGTAEVNGKTYTCTKLPEYMQNILNQGGLIASLNREEE